MFAYSPIRRTALSNTLAELGFDRVEGTPAGEVTKAQTVTRAMNQPYLWDVAGDWVVLRDVPRALAQGQQKLR